MYRNKSKAIFCRCTRCDAETCCLWCGVRCNASDCASALPIRRSRELAPHYDVVPDEAPMFTSYEELTIARLYMYRDFVLATILNDPIMGNTALINTLETAHGVSAKTAAMKWSHRSKTIVGEPTQKTYNRFYSSRQKQDSRGN